MHKARAFFYVAAGVFLLALSYNLGARNAAAQVGFEAPEWDYGIVTIVQGRTVIIGRPSAAAASGLDLEVLPEPPGTGQIVSASGLERRVLLDNCDVYQWYGGWVFKGNMLSGPTPAARESFGALKSRYRGAPGGAQPTPNR